MDLDGKETIQELHFFYDAQSKPAFVEYNGIKYRYIHNLQGDIVAIVDTSGYLIKPKGGYSALLPFSCKIPACESIENNRYIGIKSTGWTYESFGTLDIVV